MDNEEIKKLVDEIFKHDQTSHLDTSVNIKKTTENGIDDHLKYLKQKELS